jgi:CheY-like chemotaxis protein
VNGDTILVVEDHPPLRGLVAEALEAAGYRVVEAWNGQQAIAALDEHLPPAGQLCLVLLDLRLPYVSGLEVLGHLAARRALIPVVAMSAHEGLLEDAAASGAQGTLHKPFELDELLAAVRRYCPMGGDAALGDQAG